MVIVLHIQVILRNACLLGRNVGVPKCRYADTLVLRPFTISIERHDNDIVSSAFRPRNFRRFHLIQNPSLSIFMVLPLTRNRIVLTPAIVALHKCTLRCHSDWVCSSAKTTLATSSTLICANQSKLYATIYRLFDGNGICHCSFMSLAESFADLIGYTVSITGCQPRIEYVMFVNMRN